MESKPQYIIFLFNRKDLTFAAETLPAEDVMTRSVLESALFDYHVSTYI
jgi:hypothetical protein